MHWWTRLLSPGLAAVGVSAAVACTASNPVEPTDLTPVALHVMVSSYVSLTTTVASTTVPVGQFVSFKALSVTKDGGYMDVTSLVAWSVSDPTVVRPSTPSGVFTALSTGSVRVIARYQGLESSLSVSVVPANRQVYPTLSVSSPGTPSTNLRDDQFLMVAYVRESPNLPLQQVTDGVTWSSSDPTVVTVDHGLFTRIRVGTSLVTVTYLDMSSVFYVSIYPR